MNSKQIPIIINNRNRYASLRLLVDTLLRWGQENVTILDNASSFAPLIDYYNEIEKRVNIIRLEENLSNYVIWRPEFEYLRKPPFVYTDSDIVPCDSCPDDTIDFLLKVAATRPMNIQKIALSLRIDDIPDCYAAAPQVRKWEGHMYGNPCGVIDSTWLYLSGVGTTFALYLDDQPHTFNGIRVGYPYIAKHIPWYTDSANPSEEDVYFEEHAGEGMVSWHIDKCTNQAVLEYCGGEQ